MGEVTHIAWTDHTFNPWRGCSKVSAACRFCYADRDARRYGFDFHGTRQRTSASYWRGPLKWDEAAARDHVRRRVFCGSWCDVLEGHPGLDEIRADLWRLVSQTRHLDWLLLTKRAERLSTIPENMRDLPYLHLGVTAESQDEASHRIPWLMSTRTNGKRFVSVEPQLGRVDLSRWLLLAPRLDWVICGGESGPEARPFDLEWARLLRDECRAWGASFFFKQTGRRYYRRTEGGEQLLSPLRHPAGADPAEWPADLRVRETPPWEAR